MPIQPYRTTPVFNQDSLPQALRQRHNTKAGVWGVARVLEGRVRLHYLDPPSRIDLDPETAGLLLPQQLHYVELLGPMKMQVEFYDQPPEI